MTRRNALTAGALLAAALSALPAAAVAAPAAALHRGPHTTTTPRVTLLASGLAGGAGSAVGPDGGLYVPEPRAGRIVRIDTATGDVTTFASGLPVQNPAVGLGGVMDVAFLDGTAYALVTLVSPDVGGSSVDGIYRIDDASHATVVVDIGAWTSSHPPVSDFFVPTGLQYAMQPYRNGFLVSDGHHNRILLAGTDGSVAELRSFGNIVPTGLDRHGRTVLVAQAGPVPHTPADGRVLAFEPDGSGAVRTVAAGAPLLVDVEVAGSTVFALSQGTFGGGDPGSPALPGTGAIVRAEGSGLVPVATGLDRPTSLELVGRTALVVGLAGSVWRIDDIR